MFDMHFDSDYVNIYCNTIHMGDMVTELQATGLET